jgi:tRNA A58 N-methylase Trm61
LSIAGDAGCGFGHSEAQLDRLACQAAVVEPISRQLLVDAGITGGMRVLDVGTGRGDVAFLAAEFVGETGAVVGIDRAPAHERTAATASSALPGSSGRSCRQCCKRASSNPASSTRRRSESASRAR